MRANREEEEEEEEDMVLTLKVGLSLVKPSPGCTCSARSRGVHSPGLVTQPQSMSLSSLGEKACSRRRGMTLESPDLNADTCIDR